MAKNQNERRTQFEINDLIDDAVNNAVERRNQALDADSDLSGLSEEEAANISGGQVTTKIAIAGYRPICPPITLGIIYIPPTIK
ncbi:hypothetical protein [Nodularia sp. NIES-3585]|uniref:hypothetical protein n=1 Tax=Nodularia sp. NIES-3585 TaxID=1973477 RepID=UPI000B5C6826|nr:hypothetical protein [Nodularia sp. NIES-3585]GAX36782.1 hypothetical protein NIES3585_28190 [Nodularia sp. NIES-3585]